MKIDVMQSVRDYEGRPVKDGADKNLSLRTVISASINASVGDKPMTAEDKNKAFQISLKVWGDKVVDLTVDQLAFIKTKVGEVYNPLVYGRVCQIIEGDKDNTPVN